MNGRRDVAIRPETRERVLAVANELRYQPNHVARALVTGRFATIGFWMCLEFSQHRAHVVHRMQQQMKDSGYELVIRDIEREIQHDPGFSRTFQLPVDGIIAFDTPTAAGAYTRVGAARQVPFVSMGGFWATDCDFVGVDLRSGTVDAVEHLIAVGRKKIAYLVPRTDGDWPLDARMDAYCAAMAADGRESRFIWTPGAALSDARRAVRDYLLDHGDVDAIFCHNDDMAFGAYRALCDGGIKVGHDVAVVGCDGIEEVEYLDCPLTTIVQPIDEMCSLAWEFLSRRISDPSCDLQQRVLKPQLVVRASSVPS
jgi:LacI family transcriptional regulator